MTALPTPPHGAGRPGAAVAAWLWLLALALTACHFALNLQQNGKAFVSAEAYVQLHEKRPYQYRTLMAPVLGGLMRAYAQPAAKAVLAKLPVYVSTPEAAAYLTINAVAFAASCLLFAAIARHALQRDAAVRLAAGCYLAMAYLFFCLNPNVAFILPYDVPALALSHACLLCVLRRRWVWLLPLFVLATVNRETSLLVVVFLVARALLDEPSDGRRRNALVVAAALGIAWLATKAALYVAFSALPSDEGLRLAYNLRALAKPWQWPALLPLLASFGLGLWSLRFAPRQRAWGLTGSFGFAAIFAVGQITETRAFADLIVYFAVAVAQWLACPPRQSGSGDGMSRRRWPQPASDDAALPASVRSPGGG